MPDGQSLWAFMTSPSSPSLSMNMITVTDNEPLLCTMYVSKSAVNLVISVNCTFKH